MSSRRRIESSRANGAKSKGPKTAEGKRHSSMNAVKHGILARICVLSPESEEAFENLLAANVASLQPASYAEYDLIEQMTTASWRMRRIWAVERETLEAEIQKTPDRGSDATVAGGEKWHQNRRDKAVASGPQQEPRPNHPLAGTR